jgi:uroporphyrinogen-III synthase
VAESLLEAFPPPPADGERVLLARAEHARDVLPAGLSERGYAVDVLAVYRTVTATPDADVLDRVRRGEVDVLTFTSSSTVTNLCDLLGDAPEPQPIVASIGPVTSKTALERGLRVDVEASEHTIDGLVDALLSALGVPGRA